VLVLRDGENAGELARAEIQHDAMVRLMVGRELGRHDRVGHGRGDALLEVRAWRTAAHPGARLDFTLREGEIVGIAGLVGAGRTELSRALVGVDRAAGGEVRLRGRALRLNSPTDAIRAGLALVPEDRKQQGVILEMAVRENTTLASLRRDARAGGFLD